MANISVYGGSQTKPGEPLYQEALQLGRLLGAAGHTVITGGYIGTMEAVSRGAAEAGGHVVGITCDEIEAYRPGRPNPWVQEERRYRTLRERIGAMMDSCDGILALPGGPGTLTEISFTWNHLLIGAVSPRPLILIGPGWKATIDQLYSSLGAYVPFHQRGWVAFAPDVEAGFMEIQARLAQS
jgi:uncharacterized protein (TIGR00725 family)